MAAPDNRETPLAGMAFRILTPPIMAELVPSVTGAMIVSPVGGT
jgi:hypothetical protein